MSSQKGTSLCKCSCQTSLQIAKKLHQLSCTHILIDWSLSRLADAILSSLGLDTLHGIWMSSEAKEGVDRICNCLGLRCLVFISYTSAQLSFGYEQSYCTNFHYQYIIVNFFQKQKDSILDVEAVEAHEMDP